jgi:hypothetical protein
MMEGLDGTGMKSDQSVLLRWIVGLSLCHYLGIWATLGLEQAHPPSSFLSHPQALRNGE